MRAVAPPWVGYRDEVVNSLFHPLTQVQAGRAKRTLAVDDRQPVSSDIVAAELVGVVDIWQRRNGEVLSGGVRLCDIVRV